MQIDLTGWNGTTRVSGKVGSANKLNISFWACVNVCQGIILGQDSNSLLAIFPSKFKIVNSVLEENIVHVSTTSLLARRAHFPDRIWSITVFKIYTTANLGVAQTK